MFFSLFQLSASNLLVSIEAQLSLIRKCIDHSIGYLACLQLLSSSMILSTEAGSLNLFLWFSLTFSGSPPCRLQSTQDMHRKATFSVLSWSMSRTMLTTALATLKNDYLSFPAHSTWHTAHMIAEAGHKKKEKDKKNQCVACIDASASTP